MGELAVMGRSGDLKVMWSKNRPEEVEAARAQFDTLTQKKGYAAFSVKGKEGEKDQRISEFDPNAERIILVPPIAGG